jgi:hypothetical protein
MKNATTKFFIITIVIFISGCAASYKPINPSTLHYHSHDLQNDIKLSYKYDVLREKRNFKYAKKELKTGVKLIAVKVTNQSDETLNIGNDIAFYSGDYRIFVMESAVIKETLKQSVPSYLPYLLLSFLTLEVTNGTSTDTYPIGLFLGPGITIGNMLLASAANNDFLYELNRNTMMYLDVHPGETVYWIIGVRDMGYNPISIKMIKEIKPISSIDK